jgi:hypothetical protein
MVGRNLTLFRTEHTRREHFREWVMVCQDVSELIGILRKSLA